MEYGLIVGEAESLMTIRAVTVDDSTASAIQECAHVGQHAESRLVVTS